MNKSLNMPGFKTNFERTSSRKGPQKTETAELPIILSPKEKRIDQAVKALRSNALKYEEFLARMNSWYTQKKPTLKTMIKMVSPKKSTISYDTAKRLFFDLQIPCTQLEAHAICLELDRKQQRRIKTKLPRTINERIQPNMYTKSKNTLQVRDMFITINFKYFPLKSDIHLPCHFQATVRSDMYVSKLCEIITKCTNLKAKQWYIFYNKHINTYPPLPSDFVLNRLGIFAGREDCPSMIDLYYVGELDFMECPLLLCDHYFSHVSRRKHRLSQADRTNISDERLNLKVTQSNERNY